MVAYSATLQHQSLTDYRPIWLHFFYNEKHSSHPLLSSRCVWSFRLATLHILSFNPPKTQWGLLAPYYRWGKQGSQKSSNWSKMTSTSKAWNQNRNPTLTSKPTFPWLHILVINLSSVKWQKEKIQFANVLYSRKNDPWVWRVQCLTSRGAVLPRDLVQEWVQRTLEEARWEWGMVG